MSDTMQAQAIVLRRQAFRERDSRVLVYTLEHGLLDLVARGTKSPSSKLAGHVEPLSLLKVMIVPGRTYNYICGAAQINAHTKLKQDYDKLEVANLATRDLIKILKEGISDEYIFNLFKEYLDLLNSNNLKLDLKLFKQIFLLKILSHLGYRPELYRCTTGGEEIKDKFIFNISQGGLVCKKHAKTSNNLTLSQECINILRTAIKENLPVLANIKVDNLAAGEAIKIIDQFYKYQQ